MFDRDLILDELDPLHHQAQDPLLGLKTRVVERNSNVTAKLRDCLGGAPPAAALPAPAAREPRAATSGGTVSSARRSRRSLRSAGGLLAPESLPKCVSSTGRPSSSTSKSSRLSPWTRSPVRRSKTRMSRVTSRESTRRVAAGGSCRREAAGGVRASHTRPSAKSEDLSVDLLPRCPTEGRASQTAPPPEAPGARRRSAAVYPSSEGGAVMITPDDKVRAGGVPVIVSESARLGAVRRNPQLTDPVPAPLPSFQTRHPGAAQRIMLRRAA